jgi:hypothetical protein
MKLTDVNTPEKMSDYGSERTFELAKIVALIVLSRAKSSNQSSVDAILNADMLIGEVTKALRTTVQSMITEAYKKGVVSDPHD